MAKGVAAWLDAARYGIVVLAAALMAGGTASAILLEKIVAVVNGELLTLQDFEDHLALLRVFRPEAAAVERQQAFQRFIDQTLIRQEAMRTRLVEVADADVDASIRAVEAQGSGRERLAEAMQERQLGWRQVRAWVRQQLIVQAFIERRIRLFARVSDSQIVAYYQQHRQAIAAPLTDAVRDQIRRLLVEQHVNARLAELVEDLRRRASLEFPP
jgi:peptidyl-prolyl cis-trans isomerase SurA